ncbi:MAG: glycosyltransferase family 4 protein [Vicinamibacterales bacterium]
MAPPDGIVALNQMDIAPLARHVHRHDPRRPVVALSHGNASGDFLHESLAAGTGPLGRLRDRWRLGAQLAHESDLLRHDVDLLVCISETEEAIARWLGARHVLAVPRVFTPDPLPWQPVNGRIGVVTTADHYPNRAGVELLAAALAERQSAAPSLRLRLVGGGAPAARELASRFPFIEYLGPLDDAALRAEAATWSLFVHPLFWHARGASMKLATAIGWGLPIATTPAGRRGYVWGEGTLIEGVEPDELAGRVLAALADRAALDRAREETLRIARSGPSLEDYAVRFRDGIEAARRRRAHLPPNS